MNVINVAHRGASAFVPENTLAAFRRAIAVGADLLELDVQRTRDGELVIMHDTSVARTTDARLALPGRGPWHVGDLTFDELRGLDAGSWKAPGFAGEPIPTLAEVIALLEHSPTGMLLELKSPDLYPGIEAEVVAQMNAFRGYVERSVATSRLVVESFDLASIRAYRRLERSVPIGVLGTPRASSLPELATWADQINPAHRAINARYVAEIHRAGMRCLTWTVNHDAAMRRAINLGVDGIITNRPELLRSVLAVGRRDAPPRAPVPSQATLDSPIKVSNH
ncbi:glycerophosphodiester phosphodiesterase [Pengzhenrongella frigida]|nr:glycerophosphodiester phosphodiesterase family protein [Cellulomonas sp. HLT2-17]